MDNMFVQTAAVVTKPDVETDMEVCKLSEIIVKEPGNVAFECQLAHYAQYLM